MLIFAVTFSKQFMASQFKLFQRLVWLVDTVHTAGGITRDEIDRLWANSAHADGAKEYGERNFHRHREAVSLLFGIDIEYNHATKKYELKSDGDDRYDSVRAWLIDTFAINNMVNTAREVRHRILFEEIPEGTRYLSTIVTAMKQGCKLHITYKRFDREQGHSFLLNPYCLKVFRQRWYLIGKPDDHPEEENPRIYSLDRVKALTITAEPSHIPVDFNANDFFEHQFGIDRTITKPVEVRIRVTALTAKYIRTLPIHHSQREVRTTKNYSIFTFYIAPTYDFIQELRKHGSNLTVEKPLSLRESFLEDIDNQQKNYR